MLYIARQTYMMKLPMDTHIQTLVDYITDQLSSVQNPNDIYNQLIAAGWPEDQIREAFQAVHTQIMPTALQGVSATTTGTIPSVDSDQPQPQANGRRRGRIRTGFTLLKQSIRILNGNRYLFRYLLMTWLVIMGVEVVLFLVIYFGPSMLSQEYGTTIGWWVFTFFSYVAIYFLINYYAAALASNIQGIFKGERKPYSTYIAAARGKAGPIFVFSVIDAIVGMFLRFVVERIRFVGWILAYILGTAWSLGTMFVLPMIMDTDVTAPQAIKQSVNFFKQTWGEGITAKVTVNVPLGLITLLLAAIFWPLLWITLFSGSFPVFLLVVLVYLFLQITLAIIGSFANSVVNVALYYFATTHQVPPGFSADMLNQVFVKRKLRFGKKASRKDEIHPAPAS